MGLACSACGLCVNRWVLTMKGSSDGRGFFAFVLVRDLAHIFGEPMAFLKTVLDPLIFLALGLMSFVALALIIERFIYLRQVNVDGFSSLESLEIALTKHLVIIATIATNAPYVGLLGTVFGIMVTFYDLGQASRGDTGTVMTGLALALKATALGLLVAIPSMMCYNILTRKAEVLLLAWKGARA